jgi:hypothetical protein
LAALAPFAIGGALVGPGGPLTRLRDSATASPASSLVRRKGPRTRPSENFPEGDAFVTRECQAAYGALTGCLMRYLRRYFTSEPDFDASSVNYDWQKLRERGTMPW